MADVEEVEVVVAHSERATLRVADVFLMPSMTPHTVQWPRAGGAACQLIVPGSVKTCTSPSAVARYTCPLVTMTALVGADPRG